MGVRLYNERLVLSLIRRRGSLPKAEIARQTGLSAQTATAIVRQMEEDGLLLREESQRGRVGQPSVPFSLNPDGAFSLGLKIGRRSCELVLADFIGCVRGKVHQTYRFPEPDTVLDFVRYGIGTLTKDLPPEKSEAISGLGVALPFEIWSWEEVTGATPEDADSWRDLDIRESISAFCPWPVFVSNDATAACAAELAFNKNTDQIDILYFFVGWFIGGGIILGGSLFPGHTGNAGALGSIPVPSKATGGKGGGTQQLIKCASLHVLESRLREAGQDPAVLWNSTESWMNLGPVLENWIEGAASGIAHAIVSSTAVIDFHEAVIDGAFPTDVRAFLVERTRAALDKMETRGLSEVTVREGIIGRDARAIGAASLPLLANFARDREILFKE